jgi:protoporphyrinogen oxidase
MSRVERRDLLAVLGGGVAGLAIGYYARREGVPATVFEACEHVGGLCRTFEHRGFLFDAGAHRFHDRDADITRDVKRLLGDHLQPVDRPSMVFDAGRLMRFPFGIRDALRHLGPGAMARNAVGMVAARLAGPAVPSFSAIAVRRYGPTVASRFLLNYSHKLWGVPGDQLSTDVSGGRLNGLDLREFLLNAVFGHRDSRRSVDGSFLYPTRGIGMLPEALAAGAGPDAIRTRVPVTRLEHREGRIHAIVVDGVGRVEVTMVASTLPMEKLAEMMFPPPPSSILRSARSLTHRNLVLVVLFLRRPSVTAAATVYFPDSGVPFTRLTEPRNRSAAMTPEGYTSLVAEIPCAPGDDVWTADDDELVRAVQAPLERFGWIRDSECIASRVVRLGHAYPVLSLDIEDAASAVRRYLETFDNLALAGRSGRFEYRWIHDVLRQGKNIAASCAAALGAGHGGWPRPL